MAEPCARQNEIKSALRKVGVDAENAFTGSLDATFYRGDDGSQDRSRYCGLWYSRGMGTAAEDLGIGIGDMLVIDTSRTSTTEGNGIICSVVTQDGDFDEYMELQAEEHFGSDDILDVQYLYPDEAEGTKRRKKRGDSPQIKRVIIGVVTAILRKPENLKPFNSERVLKY